MWDDVIRVDHNIRAAPTIQLVILIKDYRNVSNNIGIYQQSSYHNSMYDLF